MAAPAATTHAVESAVIAAPLEKVWGLLKSLDFTAMMPSRVKGTEFLEGGVGIVGTLLKVTFQDDSHWDFKVTEISDTHHFISYELVFAEPSVTFSSYHNCISLWRVTKDNSTFMKWTSDFSNDADANVI